MKTSPHNNTSILDTFFRQIKSFLRFRLAFVFGLQTYYLIDFSKIYQLKGLEPKNKGHTNCYERYDLTKKCGMGYHTTKMESLDMSIVHCRYNT